MHIEFEWTRSSAIITFSVQCIVKGERWEPKERTHNICSKNLNRFRMQSHFTHLPIMRSKNCKSLAFSLSLSLIYNSIIALPHRIIYLFSQPRIQNFQIFEGFSHSHRTTTIRDINSERHRYNENLKCVCISLSTLSCSSPAAATNEWVTKILLWIKDYMVQSTSSLTGCCCNTDFNFQLQLLEQIATTINDLVLSSLRCVLQNSKLEILEILLHLVQDLIFSVKWSELIVYVRASESLSLHIVCIENSKSFLAT